MEKFDSPAWNEFNTILKAKFMASIVDINVMAERGRLIKQEGSMTKDEFEARWRKLAMPSIVDGGNICTEKWPDEWLDYDLLPCSPAEDFLFCIDEGNTKSDDGYVWHGKYKGENLIQHDAVLNYDVKFSDRNKICVKNIGDDFISSVSSWASWFYLRYFDGEVLFGLANWNGTKRIELSASVDWPLVSNSCGGRGVQEEIYPVGWYNKSDATIEPKKFISDILYAVKHKYQYQFERDWTFFTTNSDGTIFPIKTWEDFQSHLRQYSDIQVQARLLNTDGLDFQYEVKYSYCGGGATLWGVGENGRWARDFLRNCVRFHGEIEGVDTTQFFTLPLPIIKPEIVRVY